MSVFKGSKMHNNGKQLRKRNCEQFMAKFTSSSDSSKSKIIEYLLPFFTTPIDPALRTLFHSGNKC